MNVFSFFQRWPPTFETLKKMGRERKGYEALRQYKAKQARAGGRGTVQKDHAARRVLGLREDLPHAPSGHPTRHSLHWSEPLQPSRAMISAIAAKASESEAVP